ncbi:polysaccharide pyruvyl transferase family protein [Marivirga sp. S37H4]|uniref:Polysaccharide pyruvyl transferase family protein n=1 Tax=Marivirga aurantiaca TaxID=2802615 RepID=A0A934X1C9_9BACT|nr:polysaccharide pyruvyl transferase family protein [Marivirga aurantiaca]MBK6266521.1 polysaccharide pyruvyl transferase family protein [Marivirga aurantiaca]
MILNFYQSKNFGDALNPYIFKHFLPNFFDKESDFSFVGIGSILGLRQVQEAKRKIIFSSGFAYGSIPKIDSSYDIFCVRGPMTCDVLNIHKKYAISDGAILLQFMEKAHAEKKYPFSFMPHWESALKFDWKGICHEAGIHYISPTDNYSEVIDQIKQSEVVIAEAMHAAIVADALRVPWIPVKAYGGINSFKWQDWTQSLNLAYKPQKIRPLFNNTGFTRKVIKDKTGYPFSLRTLSPLIDIYQLYQSAFVKKKVVAELLQLKLTAPYLSSDSVLKSKGEQLVEKLEDVKTKYTNSIL